MQEAGGRDRVFWVVFVAVLAAHVWLVCSTRLLPFVDLPNHLAAATIYNHIDDDDTAYKRYYRVDDALQPNLAFVWWCGLPVFPSIEIGGRLYLALCLILLPVSVLFLLQLLRASPWFALLSFLLICNYNTAWGFVGYILSLPLLLLFAAAVGRLATRQTWRWWTVCAAALPAMFFVHGQSVLFAFLVLGVCCVAVLRRDAPRLLWTSAAALPGAALLVAWWISRGSESGPATLPAMRDYYRDVYLGTIPERLGLLVCDNYHLYEGVTGVVVAALFGLWIVVAVAPGLARRRTATVLRERPPEWTAVLVLGVSALACWVLLPDFIPGQTSIFQRYSVLVLLALIVLGGALSGLEVRRWQKIGCCAVCVLHLGVWWGYLRGFERETAGFTREFLPAGGDDARLAGLMFDATYRGRPVYLHFPCYYVVWRHGIATVRFIDYRFGHVIKRHADLDRLPVYNEAVGLWTRVDDRYRDLEYVLVRGELPAEGVEWLERFTLERSAGPFRLYARNGPD